MTNEQKCPVCGEGMYKTIPHDDGEIVYSCGEHDISEIMYRALQSRIDKAVKVAVQQERERCWDIVATSSDVNEILDKIDGRNTGNV